MINHPRGFRTSITRRLQGRWAESECQLGISALTNHVCEMASGRSGLASQEKRDPLGGKSFTAQAVNSAGAEAGAGKLILSALAA